MTQMNQNSMPPSPITAAELSRAYAAGDADPVAITEAALSKALDVPAVFLAVWNFEADSEIFAPKVWTVTPTVANSESWADSAKFWLGKRCVVCTQHAWQGGRCPPLHPSGRAFRCPCTTTRSVPPLDT